MAQYVAPAHRHDEDDNIQYTSCLACIIYSQPVTGMHEAVTAQGPHLFINAQVLLCQHSYLFTAWELAQGMPPQHQMAEAASFLLTGLAAHVSSIVLFACKKPAEQPVASYCLPQIRYESTGSSYKIPDVLACHHMRCRQDWRGSPHSSRAAAGGTRPSLTS